jgi:SNF2 family DNA or RNA helicase
MMKKTLFPHQMAAMEMMEEREIARKIVHPSYCIDLNMSIYGDITGYGKTVAMIGMILRDKMPWDTGEEHIQSFISGVYGNGCVVKRSLLALKRINTNLIVAATTILKQWTDELDETTIRYVVVVSRKKLEQMEPSEYDVVLCSPNFYNSLLERFPSYAWKRFIYDEPTHTRISSMRQVIAGFIWLITATPDMLLQQQRYSHHFISSIFTQYMDYNLYKNLIVKNDDEFVRKSFMLPEMFSHYHKCFQPVFHVVKDLLSESILEMISGGNIEGAVRCLGGNSTSNIYDLIEKDKKDSIQQAEWKILRFERMGDDAKLGKWRERLSRLHDELNQLQERVNAMIASSRCSICLEKRREPILLTCCQNIFCGECVLRWFQKNSSCPLCRKPITTEHLIYVNNHCQQDTEETTVSIMEEIPPSKVDTILRIIMEKPESKVIVFSSFQETFDLIRETFRENNLRFGEIRGGVNAREKIITEFKEQDLNILFLHSMESGAGLNLQEATDIILFHPMPDAMLTQIRGRAYRVGRTLPLHIHHLQ